MQNRYIGDTGDFIKYSLLKLFSNKLKLGINWCLVNPCENELKKNDGKHINYLKKCGTHFEVIDTDLYEKLKNIISDDSKRNIYSIKESGIFPDSVLYYESPIPFGTKRINWHNNSLEYLTKSDIIFYDPDNGLEVASCSKLNKNSRKYVFYDELIDAYRLGYSIMVYQHSDRSQKFNLQISQRIINIARCLNIDVSNITVAFHSYSKARCFFIIKQPKHKKLITRILNYKSPFELYDGKKKSNVR